MAIKNKYVLLSLVMIAAAFLAVPVQASILARSLRVSNLARTVPSTALRASRVVPKMHTLSALSKVKVTPLVKKVSENSSSLLLGQRRYYRSNYDQRRYIHNGPAEEGALCACLAGLYVVGKVYSSLTEKEDIHRFVNANDSANVKRILKNDKKSLEQQFPGGVMEHCLMTPLMSAARMGFINMAQLLLDEGAQINAQSLGGYTAVMFAAKHGHTEMLKLLIKRGATLDAVDHYHQSALDLALSNEKIACAQELLKVHAPMRLLHFDYDYEVYFNPLMRLAKQNKLKSVRLLLQNGFDVNATDSKGLTALHYAALFGRTDMVRLLLEFKINTKIAPTPGYTAAYCAQSQVSKETKPWFGQAPESQHTKILRLLEKSA